MFFQVSVSGKYLHNLKQVLIEFFLAFLNTKEYSMRTKIIKFSSVILPVVTAVLISGINLSAQTNSPETAESILIRIDDNMFSSTITYTSRMVIHHKDRTDEKTMKVWGKDGDTGFIEFTAPARDKDTKYLRLDDDLWMYLPNIEKIIKISGHLLRQSMMGSDFSYEDSMSRNKLREDYSAELLDDEDINGRTCYVLDLVAKHKEVTYYRRKIWVDKERFIVPKSELFAKTGKLLKVLTAQNIERFEDRYYPTHVTMEDKLRKNSRTEVIMEDVKFNVRIPDSVFTRRNLEKK